MKFLVNRRLRRARSPNFWNLAKRLDADDRYQKNGWTDRRTDGRTSTLRKAFFLIREEHQKNLSQQCNECGEQAQVHRRTSSWDRAGHENCEPQRRL